MTASGNCDTCSKPECRCDCGYTCGGPGHCELFKEDVIKCIDAHFKRDCDHDFTGEFIYYDGGGSVTCKNCGMTACQHDCVVGP